MKKILLLFLLFAFLGSDCSKELSRNPNKEDEAQIDLEMDGEQVDDLSSVDENDHTVYSFGGVAGIYFGCTSSFKVSEKASMDITFGTGLSKNLEVTEEEFVSLISPGEKIFGSLGSYTSYPDLISGRVEIAYTDKKSRKWCSTRIREKNTDHGVETTVKIDQPDSRFVIDNIHKIEIAPETEGFRVKGHFECYLYEVNGDARKKIKGKFKGIVSAKD